MANPDAIAIAATVLLPCIGTISLALGPRKSRSSPPRGGEAGRRKRPVLEEIFLLHRSGLLIRHYTRNLRPDRDRDILSAMLVVVQEAVRDHFRGEPGYLREIKSRGKCVLLAEGSHVILAVVTREGRFDPIVPQLTAAVADIEHRFGKVLSDWDGTEEGLDGMEEVVGHLLAGEYGGAKPSGEATPGQ